MGEVAQPRACAVSGVETVSKVDDLREARTEHGPHLEVTIISARALLDALTEKSSLDEVGAALKSLAKALEKSPPGERALERERAIAAVRRVKAITSAASVVDSFLKQAADRQHNAVDLFEEVEPDAAPQSTDELLNELVLIFDRYLVASPPAVIALALWTLHTWVIKAADLTPRLVITSPTKRCGKSRVLEILAALCRRAMPASNASAAVIFRVVEAFEPTLLLDEADSFVPGQEDIRGILNAGYCRTGYVLRCDGDNNEPKRFRCFGPVALAAIGRIPETIEDRAIPIRMERKTKSEWAALFRRADRQSLSATFPSRFARWAIDNDGALSDPHPTIPPALNDRQSDIWEPLLAIAELAGGFWPAVARLAAEALSDVDDDTEGVRTMLLSDLRDFYLEPDQEFLGWISTAQLLKHLHQIEERPWSEWSRGEKPMTARALSDQLERFKVRPQPGGDRGKNKGYHRSDLQPAWDRYLPAIKPRQPRRTLQPMEIAPLSPIFKPRQNTEEKDQKPEQNHAAEGAEGRIPPSSAPSARQPTISIHPPLAQAKPPANGSKTAALPIIDVRQGETEEATTRVSAEVRWRARAMQSRIPPSGPIPFLVARDLDPAHGGCPSCGEPSQAGQRCALCEQAAAVALVQGAAQ